MTQLKHFVILTLAVENLALVVLCLIAQVAGAVDLRELVQGRIVALVGIVDIGIVEQGGIAVAACVGQGGIELGSIVVVTKLQVAIGHAVEHILVLVIVERTVAHVAIGHQRIAKLAVVEVVVANAHVHVLVEQRRRVFFHELVQGLETALLVTLKATQCQVVVGQFLLLVARLECVHMGELVDGSHIVLTLIHQLAALQVALSAGGGNHGLSPRHGWYRHDCHNDYALYFHDVIINISFQNTLWCNLKLQIYKIKLYIHHYLLKV